MKLLRLRLRNWRAIDTREIVFGPEVTLIEAPNESGKSTLVEALHCLLREPDSSRKAFVRSVQPVGRDVGSQVEVELRSGPYHFTYAKTYNRKPATSLHIHAPKKEQLTGREAHERAWQILEETIDIGLWEALQPLQGERIAQARLIDSHALARALDNAVGNQPMADDDQGLIERARSEYVRYFTEKTGRTRNSGEAAELESLRADCESLRRQLQDVERDSIEHDRLLGQLQALQGELPGLRQQQVHWQQQLQSLESLREQRELHSARREQSEIRLRELSQQQERREHLKQRLERLLAARAHLLSDLERRRRDEQRARETLQQAVATLDERREHSRETEQRWQSAQERRHTAREVERLKSLEYRLQRLHKLQQERQAGSAKLLENLVDAGDLAMIQKADQDVREAETRLGASLTRFELRAHEELALGINGANETLAPGSSRSFDNSVPLTLQIGTLADLHVQPATDTFELERVQHLARLRLQALLDSKKVSDLAQAMAAHARRSEATQQLALLAEREQELLADTTREELEAECETLRSHHSQAPETSDGSAVSEAEINELSRLKSEGDAACAAAAASREQAQNRHIQADSEVRLAEQKLLSQEAQLQELRQELEGLRTELPDSELTNTLLAAGGERSAVAEAANALEKAWREAEPDMVREMAGNASDAVQRAEHDRHQLEIELAAVRARLEKAQSEGLFERLQSSETRLQAMQHRFDREQRQAQAARLLWTCLEGHRRIQRMAYVQPLRERIEQLGRVVFGDAFGVEISEDLSILSRTLAQETIPFDQLSVGAQEQLGIISRLAAAQLVADQGGGPLILDDALGFSDPQRLQAMGAVISYAARTGQIIVLSCEPQRFRSIGNARTVRMGPVSGAKPVPA